MNEKEIKEKALERIRTGYYSLKWKDDSLTIEQPPGNVCLLADG
tara:strand:+ start:1357 stop:1488 length:132 start_codon:yes stop_codon:yes gene_type:complete